MSAHFRPENNIDHHEENERVMDCLRRNDPALKEITLGGSYTLVSYSYSQSILQKFLPAFDAIATNTSLEILNIEGAFVVYLILDASSNDRVKRALSLNTSLKDIRIDTQGDWVRDALNIIMSSPHLEALTIRHTDLDESDWKPPPSIENITAMAQVLRQNTKVHSLTIEGFHMDIGQGAAFATAFQGNQTIKTLIMRQYAFRSAVGAVSFVEALPHTHSLEAIVFDTYGFDDDSAMRVVRTLCHTPLKVLTLAASRGFNEITQEGCERIVQALRENEHSFIKLDLFRDSQHSLWQNEIRLEIDMLTWQNRLQVEKDTWVDRFLEQGAYSQELLFLALERANKVDNEQFSKTPNMLFYLVKELPDSIAQAICDGHLMSRVTGRLPYNSSLLFV